MTEFNGYKIMFNCDWQRAFKVGYLEVAHALQAKYKGPETTENNKKAVKKLIKLCEDYLDDVEELRIRGEGSLL